MGNIDLDKIYQAALLVKPQDFTAGNEKFEAFVKLANTQAVCRMIDEIKQLRQKLQAAEAEQIIRDAREQNPVSVFYWRKDSGVFTNNPIESDLPLYLSPVPAITAPPQVADMPEKMEYSDDDDDFSDAYVNGWNDCINAMAAPKQGYNRDSDEVFGVELSVYGAPPQAAAIAEYNENVPADCLSPTVAKARRYGDPKNILSAAPKPGGE